MTAPDPARHLLLAALRATPRRHRLPALPPSADAARSAGPEVALAFALEAARREPHEADALTSLFTEALAVLVRTALQQDVDFQAQVLRAGDPQVRRFVALAQGEAADRRTVRAVVDAFAHPGKLRALPDAALRDALLRLHAASTQEDWDTLDGLAQGFAAKEGMPHEALATLRDGTALDRLRQLSALRGTPAVQAYLALLARRGPLAGSADAARHGQAAAQSGRAAEAGTLQVFEAMATFLQQATGERVRAAGSLRPPPGFPGATDRAKDEWDAALVTGAEPGPAGILLLAEVKASPAAATQDLPRLLRGLQRLARADPGHAYAFTSDRGAVPLSGAALRAVRPEGDGLPAHVFYACPSPPEARPALLGAPARALLLAQEPSLAFALRLRAGARVEPATLAPLWHAITRGGRLPAVLHQDQTARRAREAIVHPGELLEALRALSSPPARG